MGVTSVEIGKMYQTDYGEKLLVVDVDEQGNAITTPAPPLTTYALADLFPLDG